MRDRGPRHFMAKKNDLDLALLEPGDIVLCANPHDPWCLRALLFWSHAGLYTGLPDEARAFVDAVNLPVRRRSERGLPWQRVRFTSKGMYLSYADVLVLRPDCAREKRAAAAAFAAAQVGKPFPRKFWRSFFRRRERESFTCTSLIYQAYLEQGLDLSPRLLWGLALPWPSALAKHRRVRIVARGTRWLPLAPTGRHWRPIMQRLWFRYIIRVVKNKVISPVFPTKYAKKHPNEKRRDKMLQG